MSKKFDMKIIAAAAFLCAAQLSMTPAMAQNSEKVAIASVNAVFDAGTTKLTLAIDGDLKEVPKAFTMAKPNRLVFDLPGVVNASGQRLHPLNDKLVENINIIQAEGVSRVIVQLKKAVEHELAIEDGKLQVKLIGERPAPDFKAEATKVAKQHNLSAVDFRRGPAGEGRIVIDLQDPSTNVQVSEKSGKIYVDFGKSTVSESLLRRMNVTDFGTPVKDFTLSRSASGGVQMVVDSQGSWAFSSYQTDQRFVLEVAKTEGEKKRDRDGVIGYKGEKMTLNFQNIDVRNLLNVIADFTSLNIVTADSVSGNMSIRLQDVPWDQALDIIMQSRGLDQRRNGNVIWIAPSEEIAAREKERLENRVQTDELEGLRSESFQLNYANSTEVVALLTNKDQRLLSKRGSVVADPRTNQLFVQDTTNKLNEVESMLKKLDVPVRQVMIEARIVEAGDKFSRSLGTKLGFLSSGTKVFGGPNTISTGTGWNNTGLATNSGSFLDLPAAALGGTNPAALGLTLANAAGTKFLNLELSALEADGRGKIVSSPSVLTADKKKALIEQGTEIPYLESAASGAATVAFKKANLKLEVLPHITPEGAVMMSVDINKDAPGQTLPGGVAIDTKHVKTDVLVENGGTLVIGGIFMQEERFDVNKVPFLGDVPVLGNLFKNTVRKDDKTELLIFLTPRVMDNKLNGVAGR